MLTRTWKARQGVLCLCACQHTTLRQSHGFIPVKSTSAWNAIARVQRSALATKANARNANKTTAPNSIASTSTAARTQQTRKGERNNNKKKDQDQIHPATSSPATTTPIPEPKSKSTKKKGNAPVIAAASESKSSQVQTSIPAEIVDYRHSTAPPVEELDRLQALVDKLLAINSITVKRDIISEHLDQAPLLAWIYDPHRNFHVKSTNVLRYAMLRAQQRDEEANSMTVDQERKGSTDSGRGPLEMTRQQKQDAEARTLTLGQGYDHLSSLLLALSTRAISGHIALDAVILFMDRFLTQDREHGNEKSSHVARTTALFENPRSKLLLRILDKNLKMGSSIKTFQDMFPAHLLPGFNVALAQSFGKIKDGKDLFSGTLVNQTTPWFASRKLDGVRCLVRIDRETGGIEIKSRTGKDIGNLEIFRSSLQQRRILPLIGNETGVQARISPTQSNKVNSSPLDRFFSLALGHGAQPVQLTSLPDALYLDGEICVFSPAPSSSSSSSTLRDSTMNNNSTDTTSDVASAVELGTENFTKAISFARRGITPSNGIETMDDEGQDLDDDVNDNTDKDETEDKKPRSRSRPGIKGSGSTNATASVNVGQTSNQERAMFCVFDSITEDEFRTRNGTRRFSERIRGLKEAFKAFPIQEIPLAGGDSSSVLPTFESALELDVDVDVQTFIQVLTQTELKSFKQLEEMVSRGMELGWEGVMLRKDVGYEGKRSRNLLKIKQFHDAEYVVEEVMLGWMRLPVQGVYQESGKFMTNVVIRHRGNRVRVGSGFSVEDRIRYGKNPKSLLGKTITVQYFEESKTMVPSTTLTAGTAGSTEDSDSGADEIVVKNQNDKTESHRDGPQEVWSLRFPTVKAIYDKGPRQM